jgi:hypothetical protein
MMWLGKATHAYHGSDHTVAGSELNPRVAREPEGLSAMPNYFTPVLPAASSAGRDWFLPPASYYL